MSSVLRYSVSVLDHVFHRHTRSELPVAVSGDGMYIVDRDGRRYLDGSGGAAVSVLGHSDSDVRRAIKEQVDVLAFAHTGFFTTEAVEELADLLIASAPAGIERVYFLSGGSEGVETALKMARQYFIEIGEPDRTRFIARHQSYHGNTLGALSVGGNMARREPFAPMLFETTHIAPCYAYRGQQDGETEPAFGWRVADELEQALLAVGPDTVIAFVAEPVVGATLGAVPAVEGYLARIREICDRYGVLLILDEVMCGMGRTGTLHACEQDGVAPDLLINAKGLGAGYQPIGAVMVAAKLFAAFRDGSGFFSMGTPISGMPPPVPRPLPCKRRSSSATSWPTCGRWAQHLIARCMTVSAIITMSAIFAGVACFAASNLSPIASPRIRSIPGWVSTCASSARRWHAS